MFLGASAGELAWLAAAIVLSGVVTGVLAGLFGIGGGAVIVPALYEVFRILGVPEEVRMQLCIGTSLAVIVPTTVRSYLAHRDRGEGIREVVRKQVEVGIDIPNDGEFARRGFASYVHERLGGIERRPLEAGEATWGAQAEHRAS